MRPFQVGDRLKSKDVKEIVEVRWVDPQYPDCAVVVNVANQFEDETVFASDFFDNWSLIEEGTEDLAA
jgi:hypothetical protein